MRSVLLGLAVAGLGLALAACGGREGGRQQERKQPSSLVVQLQEQSFSGEAGTATLTSEGDKTRVTIDMASYAAGAQPAHIHKGSCSSLDPTPAYPLKDVVNGKSTTIVNASLVSLKKTAYAINMHRSAKDLKTYVACGNIAENAAPIPTYTTGDEGDY
jgi:hypothetical protein